MFLSSLSFPVRNKQEKKLLLLPEGHRKRLVFVYGIFGLACLNLIDMELCTEHGRDAPCCKVHCLLGEC